MFVEGRIFAMIMMVFMWVLGILFLNLARRGTTYPLRRITAADGIKEAVNRATELGRPVHYTPGDKGITHQRSAPAIVASLGILNYVASMCAQNDVRLIVTICWADLIPLVEDVVSRAYIAAGKPEKYVPEDIRWFGQEQFAFTAGVQGLMYRENVGANFMIGTMAAENLMLAEVGSRIGAMQVAGMPSGGYGTATWALICDYVLFADELFAVSAGVTKDPIQLCNLRVGDISKVVAIALIIIGSVLYSVGNTALLDFLKS